MPPLPLPYVGRDAIARFFRTVPADGRLDRIRLVAARANGQPAMAAYLPGDGGLHAYGIMVLTVVGGAIQAITGFQDGSLFHAFGLPQRMPDDGLSFLSPPVNLSQARSWLGERREVLAESRGGRP